MAFSGPIVRWYGWAAVLGGVLFVASDFVARLVANFNGGGSATGGYALWTTLSLLALGGADSQQRRRLSATIPMACHPNPIPSTIRKACEAASS